MDASPRRRLGPVAALVAAALSVGAVVVTLPAPAAAAVDVDGAREELAAFVAEHPVLPAGAPDPATGPRCPLVVPDELIALAAGRDVDVDALDQWYGFARVDAELRSDTGATVDVVHCLAEPDAGVELFALDIAPFAADDGLDVDRVARRFGVGQSIRVEPPEIGGEVAGRCDDTGRCVAIWHHDGLVLGLITTGGVERGAASLLVDLVPEIVDTLVTGLPPTTTTTTSTTSTTTSSTTTSSTTTSSTTTSSTTSTTLPPPTTTTSTTTSTSTTTLPPTTSTTTTSTTTTLPPTTSTTSTTTSTSTTTTLPPTTSTTSTSTSTSTTTTLPPTTSTTSTSTTTSTTTTTLPPTTTTSTTTLPPTTTTSTTTTTTLPPTTTSTSTTTTMAPTTTTIVQAESLWEVLAADPTLSQFTAAVQSAGLTDLLRGLDPEHPQLTVLAPTDEVLAEVAEWPEIQADPDRLERFVLAHLLPGVVPASTLFTPTDPPTEFRTLDDELLVVDPVAETVNGASIVTPDVSAPNGLVSTVDAVLVVPPPAPPPTEPAPPATETPEAPLTEPVPAPPVNSPAPDA